MVLPHWYRVTTVITPMVTGTMSIMGSSIILYIILRSHVKLSTPYHRIMFGLAISDILQSSNLALSNLPVPRDTPDMLYAIGNQTTCNIQGFFGTVGATSLAFYYIGLSGYFLLSMADSMSDDIICRHYEPCVHIFSILYSLIGSTTGMFKSVYISCHNSNPRTASMELTSFPIF